MGRRPILECPREVKDLGLFSKKETLACCGMNFKSKEEFEQHQKKAHSGKM